MTAIVDELEFRDYFADLQEEMVSLIALVAAGLGYLWLAVDIWSAYLAKGEPGQTPAAAAWVGVGALISCSVLSYLWRRSRLRLAANLLAWGILASVVCAVLGYAVPMSAVAYLFVIPILVTGALVGPLAFWLVAAVAFALALMFQLAAPGSSQTTIEIGLSLAILALVILTTWLSTRRLFTALEWVWHGYQQARSNEEIARDRQAQLQRTLKALDETTYRLERANYMLGWARDQAETARRLKQQFAQTISHELRTPLNLIIGFTELMTQSPEYYGEPLAPRYLRDVRIIHRNARHLQALINDVLDLARIEAAQMALVREEVDPAALVREAVNTARSLIESHGLALKVEIAPGLPMLWIDPTRIRQVLFNLLNNAARFTEYGSVTLTVSSQDNEVIFAVADTGVGIEAEDVGRIFEEFQQADSSTRRKHGGAGLGLAISKQFVTLHNGRIWVKSQPGVGSTFTFSLPVGREPLDTGLGAPRNAPAGPSGADSDRPVLMAITRSLTAAGLLTRHIRGCNTVVVPELAQALPAAARLLPQAIVLDQADRPWATSELERLATQLAGARVPIMACPLPGEQSLARQLDVDGYLMKPVSRQGLWDVLRQFGEKIDRILVVDDDQDFVQLMGRMLDSPVRRYQVINAYTGTEALAIIRRRRPDLVLLDVRLPDIPGPELARQMREQPEWHDIPIIMVTAQDDPVAPESQPCAITITRATAWQPAEVIRWVQNMVEATVTLPPAFAAPPEGPVL